MINERRKIGLDRHSFKSDDRSIDKFSTLRLNYYAGGNKWYSSMRHIYVKAGNLDRKLFFYGPLPKYSLKNYSLKTQSCTNIINLNESDFCTNIIKLSESDLNKRLRDYQL